MTFHQTSRALVFTISFVASSLSVAKSLPRERYLSSCMKSYVQMAARQTKEKVFTASDSKLMCGLRVSEIDKKGWDSIKTPRLAGCSYAMTVGLDPTRYSRKKYQQLVEQLTFLHCGKLKD